VLHLIVAVLRQPASQPASLLACLPVHPSSCFSVAWQVYKGEWQACPVAVKLLVDESDLKKAENLAETLSRPNTLLTRLREASAGATGKREVMAAHCVQVAVCPLRTGHRAKDSAGKQRGNLCLCKLRSACHGVMPQTPSHDSTRSCRHSHPR